MVLSPWFLNASLYRRQVIYKAISKALTNFLKNFQLSNFISRGARFFRIFPEISGNTRSKVLSQLSLFRSLQQKLARGGCTSSEYMILAVACPNKPSHISILFVRRTVQKKLRTRGSVWKIEKQKYLKEKLVKSQQSCGFWTVLCDLTKKIVRANLLPTWLIYLSWKVRNLPVKIRQMKRCN